MASEQDSAGEIEIRINGQSFSVSARPMSGRALRELATPPLPADQDLLQVTATPGESDLFVEDSQVVDFENGSDFVTVPRKILAG